MNVWIIRMDLRQRTALCRNGFIMSTKRLLLLFLCMVFIAITRTVSSESRIVCYYTNWSVYRPGTAKFSPQNINPYLCTHLIYAFGGFTKENSLKPFDKYQDIEKGGYAKFTGLKTYNKNLKTMLAIGGWNEGSSRFSPMVASEERRHELVKNAIKFLRQNHFDGLDLDWEYPSFRDGGKPRDRNNYAQLVQELREEFDRESEKTGRPRLLLTMAVPAGVEYINKGYDIEKLNKYLDWMNILSYDYHSAFEPAVNHHSPLYPIEEDNEYNFDGDLNIDYTIKHYLKSGADPKKLVLGIPTYGRSYTLFNPEANELGAPADGPGDMGEATRENGYLAFYEICENLKENNWTVVQPHSNAMGPYAYKDNQWVSYDDDQIVRKKAEYVVENGLGGIMFWSIDNDDFRGHCYGKSYPLIEAAKEALITSTSKTDDNLITSPKKTVTRTRGRTRASSTLQSNNARVQNSGGRQNVNDEIIPTNTNRKRIRTSGTRNKVHTDEIIQDESEIRPQHRPRSTGRRRRLKTTTTTSTTPSTLPTTPMYKTPEPPTTPDPGGDFKCEEDGFFPHPRDCKKYFWCLSGPADLGIIAHQFTCPAGLYFNKAADSCDYTQNVLCNKKLRTTSTTPSTTSGTTSTTTTTTESTPSFTTRRVPPRITAATSKTTYLYTTSTTTTEAPEYYDDEYEYEDDDFEEAPRHTISDSEEDPKVIKELIDLIKKVGGIEELEKYLKLQEDGSTSVTASGSTTPASISRSLYERVLSRASGKSTSTSTDLRGKLASYTTLNRNSRPGPQNEGIVSANDENDESFTRKGRPQYTTITRQRSSTEKTVEDETNDDQEEPVVRTRQYTERKTPEYVTIKRSRSGSSENTEETQEETTTTRTILRGRFREIPGEGISDNPITTQTPEYITIQRIRPSTEETTTYKYTNIERRRSTTTESANESSSEPTTIEKETHTRNKEQTTVADNLATTSTLLNTSISTENSKFVQELNVTDKIDSSSSTVTETISSSTPQPNKPEEDDDKVTPQLFRPRPFATRTRPTTSTSTTTTAQPTETKKSRPLFFRRPSFKLTTTIPASGTTTAPVSVSTSTNRTAPSIIRAPPRRRYTVKESPVTTANQAQPATTIKPRFKFATRRPYLKSTSTTSTTPDNNNNDDNSTSDQTLESSNQKTRPLTNVITISKNNTEEGGGGGGEIIDSDELADIALSLHPLHSAPLPSTTTTKRTPINNSTSSYYNRMKIRRRTRISTTVRPQVVTLTSISTSTTSESTPVSHAALRRRRPQPVDNNVVKLPQFPVQVTTGTYKPITIEYDYLDEGSVRILGQLPLNSKVLIHRSGVIQCLDQGSFPHPVSCKKFISCAKMENGDVIGWEYTCPNQLSFDPIGGICNWAADLGCSD